jgi:hypothetical protein
MKYVTFFQFNGELSIYRTLNGDFLASDCTFFLLDSYNGQVSIARVDNDFDFSRISQENLDLFDIRIHSIDELREFVNTNSDYRSTISSNNPDIFNISSPPPFNPLTDYKDENSKPFDGWLWSAEKLHWTPPVPEPELPKMLSHSWNQERLDWDIEIDYMPERKYNEFTLWKSVPRTSVGTYANACSANDYTLKSMEQVTHGTSSLDTTITSFKGITGAAEAGRGVFTTVARHVMIADIAPIALITYSEMDEIYIRTVGPQRLAEVHPQCGAHTVHELFRMIIEWAWAYTELGNDEPMAAVSHDVLRALQMPLNVRNDLLEMVPPQAVAKYIMGDSAALIRDLESPECPESFKYWLMSVYRQFSRRPSGAPTYVTYAGLPDSYPM